MVHLQFCHGNAPLVHPNSSDEVPEQKGISRRKSRIMQWPPLYVEDAEMIMKREVEIYVAVHGCLNVAFQGVHWNAFGRNSLDGGRCAFECERLNFVTNSPWQLGPWSEVGVTKAPPFPYCIRIFCFLSNIFE